MRYLKLYGLFLSQHLKSIIVYRTDFVVGLVFNLLAQLTGILFVYILFCHVEQLHGWHWSEVLFIYGLNSICFGLFSIFFVNLFSLPGQYIVHGELDRLLIRPLNPLYQLLSEKINEQDIGTFVTGIVLLVYSILTIELPVGLSQILLLLLFVLSGTVIYGAIFLCITSLSFWFQDRVEFWGPFMFLVQFGRYPITIFNRTIRFLISWIIPIAFVGFYPATVFFRTQEFMQFGLISPLISVIFAIVGYIIWRIGIKKYESVGA